MRVPVQSVGWCPHLGLWLAVILASACLIAGQQEADAQSAFRVVSEIQLSEDYPVASVRFIDMNSDGRILISDASAWEAYLFDRDGSFIRSLNPAACHPGLEWMVLRAKYVFEDRILAVNLRGRNYFFDADGNCIKAASEDYLPMLDFCTFSGGTHIFGISKQGVVPEVVKITESGETGMESQPIPTEFPTIDMFVEQQSIICNEDSGNIWLVLASTSTVFMFDQNLEFQGAVLHRFSGQKIPRRDVDPDAPGGPLSGLRRLFGVGGTLTHFAAPLGGGRIVMQHHLYPDLVIQIIYGDTVLYEEVTDLWLQSASEDGHLIEVRTGEMDQSGFLPNPKIILYKVDLN